MDWRDPDEMDEGREFPGVVTLVEIIPPSGETTPWGRPAKERIHLQIRPLDHQIEGEAGSGAYPLYIPDSEQKNSKWGLFKKRLKESGYPLTEFLANYRSLVGKTFMWRRETMKFFDAQETETTMLVPSKYLPQGWTPATSGPEQKPQPAATVNIPPPPAAAPNKFSELEQLLRRPEGMTYQQCYLWADQNGISQQEVYEYLVDLNNKGLLTADETGQVLRLTG